MGADRNEGIASPDGELRWATIDEMVEATGPLVRLEVPESIARHTWAEHRRVGHADPRILDDLETAAKERGADPSEWRVSYHDVPLGDVLSVEASTDGIHWEFVGRPADGANGSLDTSFVQAIRKATERQKGGVR